MTPPLLLVKKLLTAGVWGSLLFITVTPSFGYEPPTAPTPIDTKKLPRTAPESATFLDFLKERTHVGFGFDETYDSNLLLSSDNNSREEFTSTVETEIFFVDPRGALLYGVDYNPKAFRYHRLGLGAVDQNLRAFIDLQPGGRTQYRLDYILKMHNYLVFGPTDVDILRTGKSLTQGITREGIGKIRYALNDTNALVPQVDYLAFDDQASSDADTDRRELKAILDIDHDLIPGWTIFGGYGFDDIAVLKHKQKNSQSHGVRGGVRYELTELSNLELLFKYDIRGFETGQNRNSFGVTGLWKYQLGPRTALQLSYKDERLPSYSATYLQFRNTGPTFDISYELTPLVKLTADASYEKHRSDTRDIVAGTIGSASRFSQYNLLTGIHYRVREKMHLDLDYFYTRSKTNDYTNNTVRLSVDTEF